VVAAAPLFVETPDVLTHKPTVYLAAPLAFNNPETSITGEA